MSRWRAASFPNTYIVTTHTDPSFASVDNSTGKINDGGTSDGLISIRSALKAANNYSDTSNTVTIPAGTYIRQQADEFKIHPSGTSVIHIQGSGSDLTNTASPTIIDADFFSRVFRNL